MMTSAQVVETSVNVTSNSPSQDYTHPDDHNLPNYDMTPGFKPFTVLSRINYNWGRRHKKIFGGGGDEKCPIRICGEITTDSENFLPLKYLVK